MNLHNAMSNLTWTCEICNRVRPDAQISVFVHDFSSEYNLPEGSARRNVNYCNDNPECAAAAPALARDQLWRGHE